MKPTYEELLEIVESQQKRIEQLEKEVEKLRNELHRYHNENTPSSATPTFEKSSPNHRHQKPGQKVGHEGTSRPLPDHVDEEKDARLDSCPHCNSRLSFIGSRKRIIEDIVPAKVKVTEIDIGQYWCRHCNTKVEAPVTEALPNCRLGINTYLFVMFLRYGTKIPIDKITELLEVSYGLQISEGGIINMMHILAKELGSYYDELIQELRNSPSINGDETGWRVDGKNAWLWAFIGKGIALYTIEKSRGKKVVKRMIGKRYKGVLGSDFWSAYNLDGVVQQKCHVHLKRELKETAEEKDGRSQFHRFRKKLKRILDDGVRAKEKLVDKNDLQSQKDHLDSRIEDLCNDKWIDVDCLRIIKRLKGKGKDLFTFLVKDIDPDNNIAERGIRPAVVMRKNSYGNRSEKGADTTSVLLSVVETCNMRGQNFLDWGSDYFKMTTSNG